MLESFFEGMLILVLLLVGLVIAIQIGQHAGCKARAAGLDVAKGTGTVEGGVLGLLGLILAFTFFNQETRFEQRINLVIDQVNAMATAYDQTLQLPEPARVEIRALLRSYKDAYREAFHTRDFDEQDDPLRKRGVELYREIWAKATAACEDVDPEYCSNLLLPSIIELERVAMAMLVARQTHSPWVVMALVWILSVCGASVERVKIRSRTAHGLCACVVISRATAVSAIMLTAGSSSSAQEAWPVWQPTSTSRSTCL